MQILLQDLLSSTFSILNKWCLLNKLPAKLNFAAEREKLLKVLKQMFSGVHN